jgi:hypothetical protein
MIANAKTAATMDAIPCRRSRECGRANADIDRRGILTGGL